MLFCLFATATTDSNRFGDFHCENGFRNKLYAQATGDRHDERSRLSLVCPEPSNVLETLAPAEGSLEDGAARCFLDLAFDDGQSRGVFGTLSTGEEPQYCAYDQVQVLYEPL